MKLIDKAELRAPARVVDLEIGAEQPDPTSGIGLDVNRFQTLWCLARRDGIPVGVTLWDVAGDAVLVWAELRERVGNALQVLEPHVDLPPPSATPSVTVAICTRDRPA